MDTPRPTNAEMAQLVVMLQDAGLVEVFEDDEGHETYRLTGRGARVGRMLVMGDEADADAVLESLLGGDDAGTSGVTFRCEQVEPRSPHRPTTASAPIEVAPDRARDIHRGASDTGRDQPGSQRGTDSSRTDRRTDMLTQKIVAMSGGLVAIMLMGVVWTAAGQSTEIDAETYCSDQGGDVVELKPYLFAGTDSQVELGGSLKVCQFITQDGDSPVQVIVDLTTLHSEHPTLAGLAYLARVPSSGSGPAGSNPASSYCPDDLGGTEAFGTQASGAWVGDLDPGMEAGDTQPLGDSIDLCVFADRSAIDDFALFYHSQGEVRGTDLTTVMRYQANEGTPEVYELGGGA